MRFFILLAVLFVGSVSPVFAGEAVTIPERQLSEDERQRLELAQELQALKPAKDEVYAAIDSYLLQLPEEERDASRVKMRDAIKVAVLEKASIDAYAQVFTVGELEAMIAHYSKPEAHSADAKSAKYRAIVYPEIVKMLDKASMKVKTGR